MFYFSMQIGAFIFAVVSSVYLFLSKFKRTNTLSWITRGLGDPKKCSDARMLLESQDVTFVVYKRLNGILLIFPILPEF